MKQYLFALLWLLPAVHCLGQGDATHTYYITGFEKHCPGNNPVRYSNLPRNDNSFFRIIDERGRLSAIELHFTNATETVNQNYLITSFEMRRNDDYMLIVAGTGYKGDGPRIGFQLKKNRTIDLFEFIEDANAATTTCRYVATGKPL